MEWFASLENLEALAVLGSVGNQLELATVPFREDTLSTLITVSLHDQVACLALEDIWMTVFCCFCYFGWLYLPPLNILPFVTSILLKGKIKKTI